EDKPKEECKLKMDGEATSIKAVYDTRADIMIVPKKDWPSHWPLQSVGGHIQVLFAVPDHLLPKMKIPTAVKILQLLLLASFQTPTGGRATLQPTVNISSNAEVIQQNILNAIGEIEKESEDWLSGMFKNWGLPEPLTRFAFKPRQRFIPNTPIPKPLMVSSLWDPVSHLVGPRNFWEESPGIRLSWGMSASGDRASCLYQRDLEKVLFKLLSEFLPLKASPKTALKEIYPILQNIKVLIGKIQLNWQIL
ncbi:hypothetical protein HGM15179_020537, partial [Zosterops borbonicus]